MRPAPDLAAAAVRVWTRAYTAGLDPSVRESRRAEIDSDLWEHARVAREAAAAAPRSVAGQMLARCLLGMAADLTWRSQTATRPSRLGMEGVPMNDRIRRNWWIPAPVILLGLSALFVLTHIVGDGYESSWSHTASGWDPSTPERIGAVSLFGLFFVILPASALAVRRRHPGWTFVMLLPLGLVALMPLMMWDDAGWWALLSVLGFVTIVGALLNLAEGSVEAGPDLSPPQAERASG